MDSCLATLRRVDKGLLCRIQLGFGFGLLVVGRQFFRPRYLPISGVILSFYLTIFHSMITVSYNIKEISFIISVQVRWRPVHQPRRNLPQAPQREVAAIALPVRTRGGFLTPLFFLVRGAKQMHRQTPNLLSPD